MSRKRTPSSIRNNNKSSTKIRVLLKVPCCEDKNLNKITAVYLKTSFKNQELFQIVSGGDFRKITKLLNREIEAGKGFHKNTTKDLKKGIKRSFLTDEDLGKIEIVRFLKPFE